MRWAKQNEAIVQRSTPNAQRSTLNSDNWTLDVGRWALGVFFIMKRPFVVTTFAMTVDGKVTTKNLSPVDFTSREDKLHLFRQRALADAVLLGHTSLKRDNVRLGVPAEMQDLRVKRGQSRSPLRVIVSNKGKIDDRLKIFQSDISPIIIFSTKQMPPTNQDALRKRATLHLTG